MPEREHVPADTEPEIIPKPGEIWWCEGVGEEVAHGEIWVVLDSDDDFAKTKPRPAIVVQDVTKSGELDSVTVCLMTTDERLAFYRIPVEPDAVNGLEKTSRLMVDKVTTVKRERLKKRIGTIDEHTLRQFYLRLLEFMTPEDFPLKSL